jgi:UDP-N-acetylmuramoylalanine--D-glutamate ligase
VVRFNPRVAIVTNFSPDHLDRYADYGSYLDAKCRIFERQSSGDALIYNRLDTELSSRAMAAPGRRLSFGTDAPQEVGAGVVNDQIVLFGDEGQTVLMSGTELSLPGRHNLENALAVACTGWELGIAEDLIARSLREFPGVPHRLETVREVKGVLWVNDSKATNLASGLVALDSFKRPVILLAGGRDKGSDFAVVATKVVEKVKNVVLFGEAAPKIEEAWAERVPLQRVAGLEEAVRSAAASSRPGDVVLLSPMCASFDEFKNYEERGETFKTLVQAL